MSDDPDDLPQGGRHDDQVGYGKPPLKRRFKTSGNPNGRTKGAKNRKTIVRQVAQERHTVIENGQRIRRSTLELVLIRLRNMGMTGEKPQATSETFRLLEKYAPMMVNPKGGVMVAPAPISQKEWLARTKRHNALMEEHGFRNLAQVVEFERQQRKKAKPK